MYPKNLRAIYFGNCAFSLFHLSRLELKFEAVITSNEKTMVAKYCRENNINCVDWSYYRENFRKFSSHLGILISFGKIIDEKIIEYFPKGIINVHPSLLPRWRGASPIMHSILAGDRNVGVSIMKLALSSNKVDCGAILAQESYPVEIDKMTSDELVSFICPKSLNLLNKVLKNLQNYEEQAQSQPPFENKGLTCISKNAKGIGQIDFELMSSMNINRLWRAVNSQNCKVNFSIANVHLDVVNEPKILSDTNSEISFCHYDRDIFRGFSEHADQIMPGECFIFRSESDHHAYMSQLFIKTIDNNVLVFDKVRPFTHKTISGIDFHNGYLKGNPSHYIGKQIKVVGKVDPVPNRNPLQMIFDLNQN